MTFAHFAWQPATLAKLLRPQLLPQPFLRMVQIGRHHVFQQHAEARPRCSQGQPAPQWPGSNNGDGFRQAGWT